MTDSDNDHLVGVLEGKDLGSVSALGINVLLSSLSWKDAECDARIVARERVQISSRTGANVLLIQRSSSELMRWVLS